MGNIFKDLTYEILESLKPSEFEIRSQSFGYSHEFEFKGEINFFITIWESENLFKMNYEIQGDYKTDLSYAELTIRRILIILEYYDLERKE